MEVVAQKNERFNPYDVCLVTPFDTVNHTILLKKLEHFELGEFPLLWLRSYLCNRKQYVNLKGTD